MYSIVIRIENILNLKLHYKHESFHNLLAGIMTKKAESLEPNNQYREVYLFLSKILTAEFPEIETASDHTIMVILLLLQDLNKLIKAAIDSGAHSCLKSIDSTETNINDNNNIELVKRLKTLFKFHHINDFLNPLKIPNSVNEKVYKNIFK